MGVLAGTSPTFRNGEDYLGTQRPLGSKGARGINIHTTHGSSRAHETGLANGPGAYSTGCAVINGEEDFEEMMDGVDAATKSTEDGGPGQTLIYYTVISASRLEGVEVKQQKPT